MIDGFWVDIGVPPVGKLSYMVTGVRQGLYGLI